MKSRVVNMMVVPEGEPLFSERATAVSLDDEAGGEFLVLSQDDRELRFDFEEWDAIDATVRQIIEASKEWNKEAE